jgi:hypothetical protein
MISVDYFVFKGPWLSIPLDSAPTTKLGGLSKIQTSQHLLMKETGFPITLKAINLVDCMGLEPMSDQKCDGAHLIMLLRLLTVHVTFLDNPYSNTLPITLAMSRAGP